MKKLVLLSSLLAVALTISMLRQLVWNSPAVSHAGTAQPGKSVRAVAHTAAPVPQLNMRARVNQVIDQRVEPMSSEAEVDAYLRELISQARHNQRVGALEVEPGLEAISRLVSEIGPERANQKRMEFAQLMGELSAEFDGRQEETKPASAVELSQHLDELEVRAREQSRVTASEVEGGLAAIAALDLDPERADEMIREFSARMAALSEQLDAEQGRREPVAE